MADPGEVQLPGGLGTVKTSVVCCDLAGEWECGWSDE